MNKKKQTTVRGRRLSSMESGRDALLKAAINHFAKHSFEASSLRAIAREANVDVALCARLFGNKAALWRAVIDSLADKFEHEIKPRMEYALEVSETDPRKALVEFIHIYTEHCIANPAFPAFFIHEAIGGSGRIDVIRERLSNPLMSRSLELVKRAKAAGEIVCDDPVIYLRMLTYSISFTLTAPEQLPKRTLEAGFLKERVINEVSLIFLHQRRDDVDKD